MNKKQKSLNNKGFSLVELIIVIAIMAVLIGILAPQYVKYVKQSKVSTDITNAEEMVTAINVALSDTTQYVKITSGTDVAVAADDVIITEGATEAAATAKVNAPASKVDATNYHWLVSYDNNGVSSVKLGKSGEEKQIWPDATAYQTANK